MRFQKGISYVDNGCYAKVPYTVALDFANYFVKHGIPAHYICREKGEGYREIGFKEDAEGFDTMLAWLESWYEGHKRCPFCDSVAQVYEQGEHMHIRCTKCGCMTKGVSKWYEESYIWEFWDNRVKEN